MEKFKDNIFSGPKHVRDEPTRIKYEANEDDQLKCVSILIILFIMQFNKLWLLF